jgi:secondary thiamine-phosphate synthase enzyme
VIELTFQTERRTHVLDITGPVLEAAARLTSGRALLLYVPHTTVGIVIQENDDANVGRDLEMAFSRIVDEAWPWKHIEEGNVNPWAHARAALSSSSLTIPMQDGKPALGRWQGIYLCEFDGPKERQVYLESP